MLYLTNYQSYTYTQNDITKLLNDIIYGQLCTNARELSTVSYGVYEIRYMVWLMAGEVN